MKPLKISILTLFIPSIISSCGYTDTNSEEKHQEDPVKYRKVSLTECTKRIIYNHHSTIEKYDSISTLYFHELEEYIEPEAIALEKELESLKKILSAKDLADSSPNHHKMDSLIAELSPFHKRVVGFTFVHSFFDGSDTVSAIFVLDTMCGFGEMTLIKDKIEVDPFDDSTFTNKIKKAKTQ
jgi:hypothetical protein